MKLATTLAAVGLSLSVTAAAQAAPVAETIVKTDRGTFILEGEFDPEGSYALQGVSFTALVDIGQSQLSAKGTFTDGTLVQGVLSGQASGILTGAFAYAGGDIQAGLAEGGQVLLAVAGNSLKGVELADLEVRIEIDPGLVLAGTVDGVYSPDGGLSVEGKLNLVETFEYQKGHVAATLGQGAQATVSVVGDLLTRVALPGLDVVVDDGSGLKPGGTVDGEYRPGSGISFDSELALVGEFTYQKGDVSATLASGAPVSVEVESDLLLEAGMTGIELVLTVDGPLKLEGSTDGTYKPGSGLHFDGSLNLTEPFEFQKGDVSARLQTGASVEFTVEDDRFRGGTLPDAVVSIEVGTNGKSLRLGGTIDARLSEDGDINFDGSIQLTDPFDYQRGDVKAHLEPGGKLSVTVVENQFQGARVEDLEVQVELALGGGNLRLGGTVGGSIDPSGGLDFDAELTLLGDFEYVHGPVKVRLNTGTLAVRVEQSRFVRARIFDLPVHVDLTVPDGQAAPLDGTIQRGQLTSDQLLFRAPVHLDRQLIVRQGPRLREVGPGDGVLTLLPRHVLLRIGWALFVVPLP